MKRLFPKKVDVGMQNLRQALSLSRANEDLDQLPDRLAQVISRFESLDVDPRFRSDVYSVLNGSVELALSMVDQTYPIEHVNQVVSNQLAVLSRVMLHLQSSPASKGFAILLPERNQLEGHYSTESEATEQLHRFRNLGISPNCLVVPTVIRSLHAIQPKIPNGPTSSIRHRGPPNDSLNDSLNEDLMAPLPLGPLPALPLTQTTILNDPPPPESEGSKNLSRSLDDIASLPSKGNIQ